MRAIGVLLMVAGCDTVFGIDGHSGVDAGADAARDAGQTCWNNALTANEDGDPFVDGCDPCPSDAEVGIDDSDEDGVGDACDPDPGSKQHTVAFDGFNGQGAWMTSGSWIYKAGDYGPNPATAGATAVLAIAATASPVVDARFAAQGPCVTPGCGPGVFVMLQNHPVGCAYQYDSGSDKVGIVIDKAFTSTVTPNPEGMPDRIVEIISSDRSMACRFYAGGILTAVVTAPASTAPTAVTTQLGLSAELDPVLFHSVSVLTTP